MTNAFAMDHGDHAHPNVDFATVDAKLDAAVLRQAFFGDIQPRHDLQAADDGRLKAVDFRRHRLRVQDPVDAVTNDDPVGLRFDMHVTRTCLDRFQQDLVDQADDGSFLSHLGQFATVGFDRHPAVRLHPRIPQQRQPGLRPSRCRRPGDASSAARSRRVRQPQG